MTRRQGPAATAVRALVAGAAAAAVVLAVAPAATATAAPASGAELVVTGTVERFLVDDFGAAAEGSDAELTFVNTEDGAVQVPASELEQVADGAIVRVGLADSATAEVSAAGVQPTSEDITDAEAGADVTGLQVVAEPATSLTDTGTGTAVETAAAATSTHQVLVVVAKPAGGTASTVSATAIRDKINTSIDAYWTKVTAGQVGFEATAYGSVVSTVSAPCKDGSVGTSFTFWDEIKTKTGWTEGPGKHLVVYFATMADCGGIAGLGTVGSDKASGGVVWSNGYNTTGVLGHELGHNISLGHSQTLDCTVNGARVTDAATAQCTKKSYTDTNDIMAVSWQNQGFLNASHLRYLGVLAPISQVQGSGNATATLAPLASAAGTRILVLDDHGTRYVVEYRTATGQDAWMSTLPGWGSLGVTVRKEFDIAALPAGSTFNARESYLLDGSPATADASFGALYPTFPTGTWKSLGSGDLAIKVVSQSSTGAVVEYRTGPAAAPVAPVLTNPTAKLRTGGVSLTTGGVVAPTTWSWTMTDGSTSVAKSALRTNRALATAGEITFTATQDAFDGSVVTATGTASSLYKAETAFAASTGWSTVKSSTAVGGSMRSTATKYAYTSTKVTGSSIAVLLRRGSSYGYAAVYVDGVKVATVNMKSSTTAATRVAVVKSFGSVGTHTVTVKNLTGGTTGKLAVDGIVTLA